MRVLVLVAAMLASASTAAAFAPVMVTNPFSKLSKGGDDAPKPAAKSAAKPAAKPAPAPAVDRSSGFSPAQKKREGPRRWARTKDREFFGIGGLRTRANKKATKPLSDEAKAKLTSRQYIAAAGKYDFTTRSPTGKRVRLGFEGVDKRTKVVIPGSGTTMKKFDGVYGGFFLEGSGSSESKFAPSKKAPKAKKAPRKNPFEGLKNLKKGKKAE
mmetsp:Transcript_61777/g.169988  ORF Transcript_61777/g.169988 Transcript_61777/m.169988 type:complete len:213 (-) Transcript_61777:327-965(-)|eukprot:CAMPEP_0119482404 /NCGR_PEP_ID=MMETSP1344-20130328/10268_1 /TAXON_ID=236787 /ORGANISM="Florenciella parvula, Strain CCMP2471" /LENGTH=212 /DNA_ID=CAMNT_0007516793 /DNA_START=171 /DNA_END=809 /DNA_ORIENTATION=+